MRQYEKGDQIVEDHWLLRRLGRGSFGEVWQARTGAGTLKAIKVVDLTKPGANKEETALQIMTQVRHPNICGIDNFWFKDRYGNVLQRHGPSQGELESSISEGDTAGGTAAPETETLVFAGHASRVEQAAVEEEERVELIIAMQLCEGSLKDVLLEQQKRGALLPRDTVLRYVAEAARAIDYVNATHGIQHRDIKPENLLILADIVMVADFGLAKDILRSSSQTQLAMTPHYAAPEQSRGEVFATTDQYALAITYVQLLTGHLPYKSDSRTEVDLYEAKVKGELLLQDLSEHDRRVIRKATSPDPRRRYGSCTELVDALRSAADGKASAPWLSRAAVYTSVLVVALLALLVFMGMNSGGLRDGARRLWQSIVGVSGGARESLEKPTLIESTEEATLSLEERVTHLCTDLRQKPLLLALQDVDGFLQGDSQRDMSHYTKLRRALAQRIADWHTNGTTSDMRKDVDAIADFNRVAVFRQDLPHRVAAWRAHLTAWQWAMNPEAPGLEKLIPDICDFTASGAAGETREDDLLWALTVLHTESGPFGKNAPPSATPSVPAVFQFARWKQSLLEEGNAVAALTAISAMTAAPPCPWIESEQARQWAGPLLIRLTDRLLRLCPARPWRDMDEETRGQLARVLQDAAVVMNSDIAAYLEALSSFQLGAEPEFVAARQRLTWAFDHAAYLDGWSLVQHDPPTLAELAALCRWRVDQQLPVDADYRSFVLQSIERLGQRTTSGGGREEDSDLEYLLSELAARSSGWDESDIKKSLTTLRRRHPYNLVLLQQCGLRLLDSDQADDRAELAEIGERIGKVQPGDPLGALFRGEALALQARQGKCRVAAEVLPTLEAAKQELQQALKGLSDANLKGRCAAYLSGVLLHEAGLDGHTWSDYQTLERAAEMAAVNNYPERPFELYNARGNALEDMGRCHLDRNTSGEARTPIQREQNRQQALTCFAEAESCFRMALDAFQDHRTLQRFSKEVAPAEINCARIRIRQLELQSEKSSASSTGQTFDELKSALINSREKAVEPLWKAQAEYWLARLQQIQARTPGLDPSVRQELLSRAMEGYQRTADYDEAYGVSALWERGLLLDQMQRELGSSSAGEAATPVDWPRARCDNFKRFLMLNCGGHDYRLPLALEEWCVALSALATEPDWGQEMKDFQGYLRRLVSDGRPELAALYQDRVYVWTARELLGREEQLDNGRRQQLEQIKLRLWNTATHSSQVGERLSGFIEQAKQPHILAISTFAKLALLAASEDLVAPQGASLEDGFRKFETQAGLPARFRDMISASQKLRAAEAERDLRTVQHMMAAHLDGLSYFIYKAVRLNGAEAKPEAWQVDAALYRDLFKETEDLLQHCANVPDYQSIHAEWHDSLKTFSEYHKNPSYFGKSPTGAGEG